jgi:dTMP kinase
MFVSIEGTDAAGKTTQTRLIKETLKRQGVPTTVVQEFSDSLMGKIINTMLAKDRFIRFERAHPTRLSETLLIMSDLALETEEIIIPALERGDLVISDRHIDSHVAYQVPFIAQQYDFVEEELIHEWTDFWYSKFSRIPDKTIFLAISLETSVQRTLLKENYELNSEEKSILKRSIEIYELLGKKYPERFIIVDGEKSIDSITTRILQILEEFIS